MSDRKGASLGRNVLTSLRRRLAVAFALLALSTPLQATTMGDTEVERLRSAMQSARWTGPMLASTAETLPEGHVYTEPYFFDIISGGEHHPGSSGFYQYGLLNGFTVGIQPRFGFDTHEPDRKPTLGDFKLLSQLRLTHFTADHRIPTVAIVLNEVIPTGEHDHLRPNHVGHGSGAYATEIGMNVQHYFLLRNGRLLRGRINVLKSLPRKADVSDRSVYGTAVGFRGHAKQGSTTTLIGAVEYSVTREWVLALDVIRTSTDKGTLEGRYANGALVDQSFPSSRSTGVAPAVEYNWSDRTGILLGIWISPKGHNSPQSITPAIAFSRFW